MNALLTVNAALCDVLMSAYDDAAQGDAFAQCVECSRFVRPRHAHLLAERSNVVMPCQIVCPDCA